MEKTSNFSIENATRLHSMFTAQMVLYYAGIYSYNTASKFGVQLEVLPDTFEELKDAYNMIKEQRVNYKRMEFGRQKRKNGTHFFTMDIYF